jgi:hypothetical protein
MFVLEMLLPVLGIELLSSMVSFGLKVVILCGRHFVGSVEFQICHGWLWVTLMRLWGYEHFSVTPRPTQQMEYFRDALTFCDLHDLGFLGLPYTWDNGCSSNANVRVCLDRAVVDPTWWEFYF